MKARSGQVAVFLIAMLLAIAVLAFANVRIFLAVRARTRAMNAADAAALAVAVHQGNLLNEIGRLNIEHLKTAIQGDGYRCARIFDEQLAISFLGPLEGLRIANEYAAKNGAPEFPAAKEMLLDHIREVELLYATQREIYPEPYEGAWRDYANRLRLIAAEMFYAYPNNIDFIDMPRHGYLYNKEFYSAIAGRVWCWFKYNAPGLLDNYTSFKDWGPCVIADYEAMKKSCVNSEFYSLGLVVKQGSAIALLGVETISRLTGVDRETVKESSLLSDRSQKWFFFEESTWDSWTNLRTDAPANFPACGPVRTEYDVRGIGASCGVLAQTVDVFGDFDSMTLQGPSAEAKPFGTIDVAGNLRPVTALNGFVIDAFTDVRLVPRGSLRLRFDMTIDSADEAWMGHIRRRGVSRVSHIESYLKNGPNHLSDCWYCRQLVEWERHSFRNNGRNWLRLHGEECEIPGSGPYIGSGGTPYAN